MFKIEHPSSTIGGFLFYPRDDEFLAEGAYGVE